MNKLSEMYAFALIVLVIGMISGALFYKHSLHPVDALSLGAVMAIFILIIVVILETKDDE